MFLCSIYSYLIYLGIKQSMPDGPFIITHNFLRELSLKLFFYIALKFAKRFRRYVCVSSGLALNISHNV